MVRLHHKAPTSIKIMINQDQINSYIAYLETQDVICHKISHALWLIKQNRAKYNTTWHQPLAIKDLYLAEINDQIDIVSELTKQLNVLAQNNPLVIQLENQQS